MWELEHVPRVSGTFPNVTAISDTAPGAKDGTPLHEKWVNDIFGVMQAVLNGASLTPDNTVESCGAAAGNITGSQFIEALQLMLAVPGEIVGYPSDTIPTGARLLKLSGQCVSLTTYSRLINVWCGAGTNATAASFYRTSDSGGTTRSSSGNYMVLPDFRGHFLRGRDAAKAHDPHGDTREFGDVQGYNVEDHTHEGIYHGGDEVTAQTASIPSGSYKWIQYTANSDRSGTTNRVDTGWVDAMSATTADEETRPVNSVVTWCIRY